MTTTLAAILQGTVIPYIKTYATSQDPVATNTVDWTGWTAFGDNSPDGLTVEYTPEVFESITEQHNAPVKMSLVGEELKISFALSEYAAEQMIHPFSSGTYTVGAVQGTNENLFTIGDGSLVEYSLGFEGIAKTGGALVVFFPKVIQIGTVGTTFVKNGLRLMPMEFKALSDTTESDGATLMKVFEITSA